MHGNEFLFQKEYDELKKNEKEIKESLKKPFSFNGEYELYGLLDYKWYHKYKTYIQNLISGKPKDNFIFSIKEIDVKTEEKFYFFLNNYTSFNFISKFILVTKKFHDLL